MRDEYATRLSAKVAKGAWVILPWSYREYTRICKKYGSNELDHKVCMTKPTVRSISEQQNATVQRWLTVNSGWHYSNTMLVVKSYGSIEQVLVWWDNPLDATKETAWRLVFADYPNYLTQEA